MRVAVAGDSAGEDLARVLAEALAELGFTVEEASHTEAGLNPFYANLAERLASRSRTLS